jgi:site-specific recombinase XerD
VTATTATTATATATATTATTATATTATTATATTATTATATTATATVSGVVVARGKVELRECPVGVGPLDGLSVEEILAGLPSLPIWSGMTHMNHLVRIRGARDVLEWLLTHPGAGWQQRWLAAGADTGTGWIEEMFPDDPRCPGTIRDVVIQGLAVLLLRRVVRPSYEFLTSYHAHGLFRLTRKVFRPELFAVLEQRAAALGVHDRRAGECFSVICKIVLHTGRGVDELTLDDLLGYRAWMTARYDSHQDQVALAWELLREVGADMGPHTTFADVLMPGPRPTTELVDVHRIRCRPVRDLLVRYLDERRPALDYTTFTNLARTLAGLFWATLEAQNPGIESLHLPRDVADAWTHGMRTITGPDGATRERAGYFNTLILVRAFYLDIREWALEDPSWAPWAVPCPIRRGLTTGMKKATNKTTAAMHQRTRERLPHLPQLVDTAQRLHTEADGLLAAARAATVGTTFEHQGHTFRRFSSKAYPNPSYGTPSVHVEDLATGVVRDAERDEDITFWAWAIIETLRHTGVRIEELTEITHLALISYRLPSTGEVVPMLQIVPSKTDQERLLLISPELAGVLALIITRLRRQNQGVVPLTARYCPRDRVTGTPLPHLFQRRKGWKWQVISYATIHNLLNRTIEASGLHDATGAPLRFTAHDFRRIFATESVAGGLPVHIVARLLGHANINTTQAYMAVFDEELVGSYRAFLDKRRAARPEAEYREPSDAEWTEFQQHFELRKLELGECGRPYGTPCKHEHACIRCPSLRLDPSARPRLVTIVANLRDRIQEARANGWLGEVQGLQTSLDAGAAKLVALDRMRERATTPVNLGVPIIARS